LVSFRNVDAGVVDGFGDEWSRFDQAPVSEAEGTRQFEAYFSIFPWKNLSPAAEGFDAGCGSGRWARFVAPRVGALNAIDASPEALEVARRNLAELSNVRFLHASVADMPLADASQDFGYSIGVLHHIPDTYAGLEACVRKLKPGAPLLVYLYYRFDNRPLWFRTMWRASDHVRRVVSRLPHGARYAVSQLLAVLVYWPLSRLARLVERCGASPHAMPLSFYRQSSLYTMRTDALDRFGTRLERRFTRREIAAMLESAGLSNIRFRDAEPYWCAVGVRR
jgi:SAM-dependent methyltransferase